jgi:NADPH:quinone reductase-like Zn-dependent oxidoreductase
MKAALVKRYGKQWSIEIGETARPVPDNDDILVRVHATTVNRTDLGELLNPLLARLIIARSLVKRRILGLDFAGVVEATGPQVTRFKIGDRVFGLCGLRRDGSQAEFVLVKETGAVARLPDRVAFGDSVIGEGAYYASGSLRDFAPGPGQKMLVYGASGAIGSAAVQLAKETGAEITAAVQPQHLAMAATLGANRVVDCTAPEFDAMKGEFDFILDAVGKLRAERWRPLLRPGGRFATTDAGPKGESMILALRSRIRGTGEVSIPLPARADAQPLFEELAKRLADGRYRAIVDRRYPLEQIADAYRYVATGQKAGIVVVELA